MPNLPQREGRPSLDLTPDDTPSTAGWCDRTDDPGNPLNAPVPLRKGASPDNGWGQEAVLVDATAPAGSKK